jgi:hypothetical protein
VLANPPKSQQPKANNALQDLDGLDGHNQLPKLIFGVKFTSGLEVVAKPASRRLATAAAWPRRQPRK